METIYRQSLAHSSEDPSLPSIPDSHFSAFVRPDTVSDTDYGLAGDSGWNNWGNFGLSSFGCNSVVDLCVRMAVAGKLNCCLLAYSGTAVFGSLQSDFHDLVGHMTLYTEGVLRQL